MKSLKRTTGWEPQVYLVCRNNFKTKAQSPKSKYIYWILSAYKDLVGSSPKKISRCKFWSRERFTEKKSLFANFRARTGKKVSNRCALWSWPGVKGLASRAFQSQVTQIHAHQNRPFWGVFWTKQIFLAKQSIFAKSRFQFPESYCCNL